MPIADSGQRLIVSSFRGHWDFYVTDRLDTADTPVGLKMGVERPTKTALIEGLERAGFSTQQSIDTVLTIAAVEPSLLHDPDAPLSEIENQGERIWLAPTWNGDRVRLVVRRVGSGILVDQR